MRLDIPHVSQPRFQRSCGAACLQMLYQYYGITEPYDKTWRDISLPDPTNPLNRYCRNALMLKKLLAHGFKACVVSVDNITDALEVCEKNKISVILNHRMEPYSDVGHYSVYLYTDYKGVHVNNPESSSGNSVIKLPKLQLLMSDMPPSREIVQKNTLILVSQDAPGNTLKTISCEADSIPFFALDGMRVNKLVCHYHCIDGHWVSV